MEDLKHTPGKWNPCNPGDYSDYEGQSIVIEGDDERLAVVLGDDRTAIANARLIAAAPEMFEALKKLRLSAVILLQNAEGCAVNHYGVDYSVHGEPGWLRDCRATIETANAALAKARGEP